jgi:hypothetical protein
MHNKRVLVEYLSAYFFVNKIDEQHLWREGQTNRQMLRAAL